MDINFTFIYFTLFSNYLYELIILQEGLKLFIVSLLAYCSECANILYVTPFTSKSHYMLLGPLGHELARRGHNVTVITANKEDTLPSNYHQVMIDRVEIWEVLGKFILISFRNYEKNMCILKIIIKIKTALNISVMTSIIVDLEHSSFYS